MRIDLHLHSTASDGALTPRALVDRAAAGGLDVVALADHDTAAGVEEAVEAAGGRLHVVPAIELSAGHDGRDLHILGYGIDPTTAELARYEAQARAGRSTRIRAMIERLEALDVSVEFDAVVAEAGPDARALARPHLARVLLADGHVTSFAEAFDRFIGDQGPAYVPTEMVDVAGAIRLIHEAGGIAVWAHPPVRLLGPPLREFVEAGLDGIECYRPRVSEPDLRRLLAKARRHHLLVGGGSDWHGDWHGELGAFHLDRSEVGDLLDRLGL